MPLGILKRQTAPVARPGPHGPASPAASRAGVLEEIEDVGVGSFWATDEEGRLTYLSEKAIAALGEGGAELIGRAFTTIFEETSLDGPGSTHRSLAFRMRSRSRFDGQIVEVAAKAGRDEGEGAEIARRWWRISGRPYSDGRGHFRGYRGDFVDITSEFRQQQSITRQSRYDELTGLANRRRLGERLSYMIGTFKATGRCCALIMLDLDRFKQVNDTMGHPAGDELLKQVAERLTAIVKERGEIGRLGGDEFQILLPDLDDRGELADLAARIIQMLSQPYSINGRRASIGASVGIAVAPYDGIEAEELNAAVDLALYAAKEGGRQTFRFYTAEMRSKASTGVRIEEDLRDALDREELGIKYQPLVDPSTNGARGFEALMRWEHADSGPISPDIFIPIAEQTDLIMKLGEWALRQACMDAAQWPGQLRVAVNVSPKQFMNADFPRTVAHALSASGLNPSRLELEITEGVFVGEVEQVDQTFLALKKLGVRLVMDDFGTGYSSLGYLKRAPFSKIKIDQSFVRGCTGSGDTNPAIISAIVALAEALGMETVAEGVEAMDELALVKGRGASLVQGYIFSRPLSQAELMERLDGGELILHPDGPPRYRADRISVYRKIGLIHEDHYYDVMLRNLSRTGARIEGLAGVPVGTDVVLDLGGGQLAVSKVVHSTDHSQGLQFETKLIDDRCGGLITRHRVSPYALAEAGMPLSALGPDAYPFRQANGGQKRPPKFVQLSLSS